MPTYAFPSGRSEILACSDCGAVVSDSRAHDRYHTDLSEALLFQDDVVAASHNRVELCDAAIRVAEAATKAFRKRSISSEGAARDAEQERVELLSALELYARLRDRT